MMANQHVPHPPRGLFRRPDKQQTTRERSSSSDQFCGKFTASTATTELASTGLERGRTRERSLSWHFRERLPVSSPAGCTPRRLDDVGFRAGSETGRGEGGAQAGAMKKEEMMAADGDIDRRRSVSIDANQLFRRKKKVCASRLQQHVLFTGTWWVFVYV